LIEAVAATDNSIPNRWLAPAPKNHRLNGIPESPIMSLPLYQAADLQAGFHGQSVNDYRGGQTADALADPR